MTRITSISSADCNENFFPCVCILTDKGEIQIFCHYVPAMDVKQAFSRTTIQFVDSVSLTLNSSDLGKIPEDVLGGKAAKRISIFEDGYGAVDQLSIHPDAFISSSYYTLSLEIFLLDVGQLDWRFLSGFFKLENVYCGYCGEIHSIQSLPYLPSMTKLRLDFCTGLNEITTFPALSFYRLQYLQLTNCQLTDESLNLILGSFANSSSAETIDTLALSTNWGITRFPADAVSYFTNLITLEMDSTKIASLDTGSVTIRSNGLQVLSLTRTSLSSIESGAFVGM